MRKNALVGTCMSLYIEMDNSESSPPFSDPIQIISLTEGSFALNRNYDVFDAIAGGRNSVLRPTDRDPSREPLFPPRGLPSPCSADVGWDYFYLIATPSELPNRYFWPDRRCVSPEIAAEWVRDRGCHEAEFLQWFNCDSTAGRTWRVVSQPGSYNATWLQLDEFDAALRHHRLNLADLSADYRVIQSSLVQLVNEYGRQRVRLVVWFSS